MTLTKHKGQGHARDKAPQGAIMPGDAGAKSRLRQETVTLLPHSWGVSSMENVKDGAFDSPTPQSRAISSVGQSPRLITGLSRVRVPDGPLGMLIIPAYRSFLYGLARKYITLARCLTGGSFAAATVHKRA